MTCRARHSSSAALRLTIAIAAAVVTAFGAHNGASAQDVAVDSVAIAMGDLPESAGNAIAHVRRYDGGVIILLNEHRATARTMEVALMSYRRTVASSLVISERGYPLAATDEALGTLSGVAPATAALFAQLAKQPRRPVEGVGLVKIMGVPPSLTAPREAIEGEEQARPRSQPEPAARPPLDG